MNRPPRLLSFLTTAALAVATISVVSASAGEAAPDDQSAAATRLRADADGTLTLRSHAGVYDFVGVPAGVEVDNPGVTASSSVADAASAAVARYGAALGSKQPGTTLSALRSGKTVTGDVVRYQQNVSGLPVMGGELVVSLRADRELDSILAKTSRATKVPTAAVSEAKATATAKQAFLRQAGSGRGTTVTSLGRWVVDPTLIGAAASLPTRTAWRFEVTRSVGERRLVLVDDQTGFTLMNTDLINESKNRVVCDNNNVSRNPNATNIPCVNSSADLVRTEAGPAAALSEANIAFDLGGVVHDNYQAFGGFDLTDLIGRVIDGASTKALAQTVRWCYTGYTCPYANAFWDGSQMYYGQGYAVADDVVGHEMTHGVTERNSGLFYWGQSGAMNESISDIMGEIIDHRNVTAADVPATEWALAEDLPGFPTGLRNIQDPTLKGDPDKTSSALYVKEACCAYPDEDGVHSNSGVGNKTFYLASQGGVFNSQTITGIDAGDATLTRSAKLWLLTDQTLSSGSDYADEAAVLEQSCAALQTAGVMTAANCTAVHQSTLATELRTTPVNNPQPADATMTCPTGSVQVLFDSETGTPATKFTAGSGWSRDGIPGWGENAHSNPASWSVGDATTAGASSLTATAPIALPAGQPAYLFFHHWRVLDYAGSTYYDGGAVEINAASTAASTWVNGPNETMASGFSNPIAGQKAFGGDSRGYVASRLDLSSFAGTSVTPRFTSYTDSSTGYIGWYVDDIKVYTCKTNTAPVVNAGPDGAATVGSPFTSSGSFTDDAPAGATATVDYGDGSGVQPLVLTGTTFNLSHTYAAAGTKTVTVSVTDVGTLSDSDTASVTVSAAPVQAVTKGTVTVKGKLLVGKKLKAKTAGWLPAGVTYTYQWLRNGKVISGATAKKYLLTGKDKGKKLSVRVVGSKAGYTSATVTSAKTGKIKKP